MKKIVIAATLLLSVQFASAQTADFKKDVVTYIQVSGSASQMTAVLEPILENLSAEDRTAFNKELQEKLPSLYDKMAESLMQYYTHEDVKKMIEFYNSPVGKKIQQTTPKITKDLLKVGQSWGVAELQPLIMKYLQ